VLEQERVREVIVALEHAHRCRPAAVGPHFGHGDVRLARGVRQLLEEDVIAAVLFERERVGPPVAGLRRHQPRIAREVAAEGLPRAEAEGERPLLGVQRLLHAAARDPAQDRPEILIRNIIQETVGRRALLEPSAARAVELAQRAHREFGGLGEQVLAVARHRQRVSARARLVGEPRRGAGRETRRQARPAQRLVLCEAEAPHALARDAVEAGVVELAQREGDVEIETREAGRVETPAHGAGMRYVPRELDALLPVARDAERGAVERAVEPPPPRRVRPPWIFRAGRDERDFGEPARRHLGEGVDHPARLQRRVGEDADPQLPRLRVAGYKRHTRRPSRW
jgi:hypothetical protein